MQEMFYSRRRTFLSLVECNSCVVVQRCACKTKAEELRQRRRVSGARLGQQATTMARGGQGRRAHFWVFCFHFWPERVQDGCRREGKGPLHYCSGLCSVIRRLFMGRISIWWICRCVCKMYIASTFKMQRTKSCEYVVRFTISD